MTSPGAGTRGPRAGWRPAGRPLPRPVFRTPLRAVPDQHRRPGRTFVVLLVAVLASGLVGLLVLNTTMQRAAFTLQQRQDAAAALAVRAQVLDLQVDRLRSPEVLGKRALELGMVPMPTPAFLRLSDGEIVGDPVAAIAGTGLQLVPPPPPKPSPRTDRPTAGGPERGRVGPRTDDSRPDATGPARPATGTDTRGGGGR